MRCRPPQARGGATYHEQEADGGSSRGWRQRQQHEQSSSWSPAHALVGSPRRPRRILAPSAVAGLIDIDKRKFISQFGGRSEGFHPCDRERPSHPQPEPKQPSETERRRRGKRASPAPPRRRARRHERPRPRPPRCRVHAVPRGQHRVLGLPRSMQIDRHVRPGPGWLPVAGVGCWDGNGRHHATRMHTVVVIEASCKQSSKDGGPRCFDRSSMRAAPLIGID